MPRFNEHGFTLAKGKSRGRIDAAIALALAVDRVQRTETGPRVRGGGGIRMKAKRLADLLILTGLALAVAGIALIYPPAALVIARRRPRRLRALAIEVRP